MASRRSLSFGPARVVQIKPAVRGFVTHRQGDSTIGKAFGSLRHMKWKAGQPDTPQELRRRALRKALVHTGRVDPVALAKDAALESRRGKA